VTTLLLKIFKQMSITASYIFLFIRFEFGKNNARNATKYPTEATLQHKAWDESSRKTSWSSTANRHLYTFVDEHFYDLDL